VERSCATGPCGLPAANPCRMPADVGNVKPKTSKDIHSQGMTWQTEAEAIPSLLVGQVGSLRKADMVPSLLVGQVGSLRRADMVPSMLEGQDGSLQRTDAVPLMLVDQEGSLRRTGFEPGVSAAAVVRNSWQWRGSQHSLWTTALEVWCCPWGDAEALGTLARLGVERQPRGLAWQPLA